MAAIFSYVVLLECVSILENEDGVTETSDTPAEWKV